MLIAVDLDDVQADSVPAFNKYHNEKYGTNFIFEDIIHPWNLWGKTKEEAFTKFLDFYDSDYFNRMKPVEGAQTAIEILSKEHKLITVTSRPEKAKRQSLNFISYYFPARFYDIYFTSEVEQVVNMDSGKLKKNEICRKLNVDLMIEDMAGYALACAESGITAFLFAKPWNKDYIPHEKIIRVKGWEEILERLRYDNIKINQNTKIKKQK